MHFGPKELTDFYFLQSFHLLILIQQLFKQNVIHSPWNCNLKTKQLFVSQLRAFYRMLSKWQKNIVSPHAIPESVVLGEEALYLSCISSMHSPGGVILYKSFPFHYGTLLGMAIPIKHSSDNTQDTVGISYFKIILCRSVIGVASANNVRY